MTKSEPIYQPGPVFHDAVAAGLKAIGTTPAEFCEKHGVMRQNIRHYTTGFSNGPKGRRLRKAMVEAIGADLFAALYQRRLEQEGE